MKKKILLGLSGSVACSKAELFVIQNSEKFEFKFLSTHNGLNYCLLYTSDAADD